MDAMYTVAPKPASTLRAMLGAAALFGLVVISLWVAPPAGAQTEGCIEEPYSGGQQCPPPPTECQLDHEVVDPGNRVRARGSGFGPGQDITGTFDGVIVFEVSSDDGTFDQTFTVPDRAPGDYNLIARSASQECDPPITIRGAGAQQGANLARDGGAGSGGLFGTFLPRTGTSIALLALLAVALLGAGSVLRRHSKRSGRGPWSPASSRP